jgi:lambda family phage tail tape measure protein
MASEIANIGFRAETSELDAAKLKMQALGPAAKQAEKAANDLAKAQKVAAVATADAASKQANAVLAAAKASETASRSDIAAASAASKIAAADLAAARAALAKQRATLAAGAATDKAAKASRAAAAAANEEAAAVDSAAASRKRYSGQVPLISRGTGGGNPMAAVNDNIAQSAGAMKANVGNIAAQFQDIGVTAAMGMNPLLIALQQGTQLSAVFAASGQSLGATLKAAFASVISPVALFTIGLVALAAAALQFVNWTWLAQQALNGLATILPVIAPYALAAGAALALAFAPAIATAIWSITIAITAGLIGAVGGLIAAIGAVPLAIGLIIADLLIFRDAWKNVLGVDLVAVAKDGVNLVIGAFVAAYHDIEFLWKQFPDIIGAAAVGAANAAIKASNAIIQAGVAGINVLIRAVNSVLSLGGIGAKLGMGGLSEIEFSGMDEIANGAAERLAGAVKSRNTQLQADLTADYLGAIGGAVDTAVTNISTKLTEFAGGLGATDEKKKKGGGATEKDPVTELEAIANGLNKLMEPFNQAKSAIDAAKDALANGIITNEQYAASLAKIEAAFLKTGGSSAQWAKIIGENTDRIKDKLNDLVENSLTRLGDEFINLAVDGKANFADLAKSIIKDLLRIMWQALVVGPILRALGLSKGGSFGVGGGGGVPLPNALGNAFSSNGVAEFASGGSFTNKVVSKPTLFTFANGGSLGVMGEAGPEAIMPLERGPDGSLGVQMYGGGRSTAVNNNSIDVHNSFTISGAISREEIVSEIKQTAETTKDTVKKSMVGWLNQYQADGAFS